MGAKILSVIVPTYNMEKYLSYCMESFLISKNMDKLEVIVVNDGSTDNSLEIAKKYASCIPDVFRVIDKRNGNYGSCINAALPVASAKYIKVIDADDSVESSNLDEFITFLCDNDIDLALSDFLLVDESRKEIKRISYEFGKSLIPMDMICTKERFKDMEMHAVTYRREILLKSGYRQTEGVAYTDQQWIFAPMAAVRTVGIFNKPVYKYLVGRAGQTIDPVVKVSKMTDRTRYVLDMIKQYDVLCPYATPEVKEYLDARIHPNIQDIYITYFSNSSKVDKELICIFDDDFRNLTPAFYHYIGSLNFYIKTWRILKGYCVVEKIFCKCFAVLLRAKILLKK